MGALFLMDEDENPAIKVVGYNSSMEKNGWFKEDEVWWRRKIIINLNIL